MAGSSVLIFARTSAMTSSISRLRDDFNFTEMSPVLASVTDARPSCMPVRREVYSTSGVLCSICSRWRTTRFVSAKELPAGMM